MDLVSFILTAIIAFIIGTVADRLSPVSMPGDWAGALIAGFIGGWIGPYLFGTWGPMVAGFSLIPSLIGAFIVVIIVGMIKKKM